MAYSPHPGGHGYIRCQTQTRRPFKFGLITDFILCFLPTGGKMTPCWNQSKCICWLALLMTCQKSVQNDHQPCSRLPDVFFYPTKQKQKPTLCFISSHILWFWQTLQSCLTVLTLSSSYQVSSLRNDQSRAQSGTEQISQGPGAVPSTEDQNGHSFPGSNHSASPARKAPLTDNKVYK